MFVSIIALNLHMPAGYPAKSNRICVILEPLAPILSAHTPPLLLDGSLQAEHYKKGHSYIHKNWH
jgi:hypothetical protein